MELRKTEKKTIDGIEYEVSQLGAITGSKVFVRVLKLLGPLFSAGVKDMGPFLAALKEEDLEYLTNVFSPVTFVKGMGPTNNGRLDQLFDAHFVGRYDAMVQWLLFCLQLNFASFLKGKSVGVVAAEGTTAPLK